AAGSRYDAAMTLLRALACLRSCLPSYVLATVLATFASAVAIGCHKPDPPWAQAPAAKSFGEPTIAGEPLAVLRLPAPPTTDGGRGAVCWATAAVLGPLVDPMRGGELADSPVAAFARMGWTDQALYLGFVVRDRSPRAPFSRDERDPHVWGQS